MSDLALELAVWEAHEAAEEAWERAERRRRMSRDAAGWLLFAVLVVIAVAVEKATR